MKPAVGDPPGSTGFSEKARYVNFGNCRIVPLCGTPFEVHITAQWKEETSPIVTLLSGYKLGTHNLKEISEF
jgi:hypothetical protein